MPESITATSIVSPLASVCASPMRSLASAYCAGSPPAGIAAAVATAGVGFSGFRLRCALACAAR